jgi:hypothetical protein
MKELNVHLCKTTVHRVDVFNLERQRALFFNQLSGGFLQEYRKSGVVLDRDCTGCDAFEFDLEPQVLYIPVARSEAIRNRKHYVIELDQRNLLACSIWGLFTLPDRVECAIPSSNQVVPRMGMDALFEYN